MSVIGIILGVVAIGLFVWLRKEQQMDNGLHAAELDHTHHGMNAMMDNFNKYQVETDRKIAELEKQLEIKIKSQDKKMEKHLKELPFIIGKVVGQIEFSQDIINRKK
jgi:ATP-dependent 26S proteasome regulatory subunit